MYSDSLKNLLLKVERPARYCGGELNSVVKNPDDVAVRFAFAFPDVYEIGMSHLGLRLLYHVLNSRDDTWCERAFAPWPDFERELRAAGQPLYGLESGDPIGSFDIIGFTLQYEMSYTNILNMLDLAGLPLHTAERTADMPLVIAGGPCAFNPEPLWEFIDCFALGDGEETIGDIVDVTRAAKAEELDRPALLRRLAALPGVYVPSLHRVDTHTDGTIAAIVPLEGATARVQKRIWQDFDAAPWPERTIVPFLDVVHDRVTLEIFRGCTRGCRFCQAGMLYRPVRERSVETLVRHASAQLASSGYDEVSLSSLSSGDYSQLPALIKALKEGPCAGQVSLSLPSLRLDAHAKEFMDTLEGGRHTGLTLAPEAGTQRLRDVINKNVTEEDLLGSVRDAFAAGWDKVKLYFMIGLPTETDEDLYGIADLARLVVGEYYKLPKEKRGRPVSVSVSTSNFVPKSHTPFQWWPQDTVEELKRKQKLLKNALKIRGVNYSWHDAELSYLEAVIARGGRPVSRLIEEAWRQGCRFDSWREHFRLERWDEAFRVSGVDGAFWANRAFGRDEVLPWAHIDSGIDSRFLWQEWERAQRGELTPDCRQGCLGCGLMDRCGGAKQ